MQKSLRNGVHHANAVVWEPVYRTHLHSRVDDRIQPSLRARAARGEDARQRDRDRVPVFARVPRVDRGEGVAPELQAHRREVRLRGGAERVRGLDVEGAKRERDVPRARRERERAEVVFVVVRADEVEAVLERRAVVQRRRGGGG